MLSPLIDSRRLLTTPIG